MTYDITTPVIVNFRLKKYDQDGGNGQDLIKQYSEFDNSVKMFQITWNNEEEKAKLQGNKDLVAAINTTYNKDWYQAEVSHDQFKMAFLKFGLDFSPYDL